MMLFFLMRTSWPLPWKLFFGKQLELYSYKLYNSSDYTITLKNKIREQGHWREKHAEEKCFWGEG
jgi:hypothetical protein